MLQLVPDAIEHDPMKLKCIHGSLKDQTEAGNGATMFSVVSGYKQPMNFSAKVGKSIQLPRV